MNSNGYYIGTSLSGLAPGTGKTMEMIRLGGKYAGNLGTVVSVGVNTKDVIQGEITPARYSYRMTGTAASIVAGSVVSGGFGFAVGLLVVGAEYTYDNAIVPMAQEIQYQFYMFEESLNPTNW